MQNVWDTREEREAVILCGSSRHRAALHIWAVGQRFHCCCVAWGAEREKKGGNGVIEMRRGEELRVHEALWSSRKRGGPLWQCFSPMRTFAMLTLTWGLYARGTTCSLLSTGYLQDDSNCMVTVFWAAHRHSSWHAECTARVEGRMGWEEGGDVSQEERGFRKQWREEWRLQEEWRDRWWRGGEGVTDDGADEAGAENGEREQLVGEEGDRLQHPDSSIPLPASR